MVFGALQKIKDSLKAAFETPWSVGVEVSDPQDLTFDDHHIVAGATSFPVQGVVELFRYRDVDALGFARSVMVLTIDMGENPLLHGYGSLYLEFTPDMEAQSEALYDALEFSQRHDFVEYRDKVKSMFDWPEMPKANGPF